MPQALNRVTHQQWATCDRCGFLFPLGQLTTQKGLRICTRRTCFDNLTVERRQMEIERVLGVEAEPEGVDMREIDRGFYEGEEVY